MVWPHCQAIFLKKAGRLDFQPARSLWRIRRIGGKSQGCTHASAGLQRPPLPDQTADECQRSSYRPSSPCFPPELAASSGRVAFQRSCDRSASQQGRHSQMPGTPFSLTRTRYEPCSSLRHFPHKRHLNISSTSCDLQRAACLSCSAWLVLPIAQLT